MTARCESGEVLLWVMPPPEARMPVLEDSIHGPHSAVHIERLDSEVAGMLEASGCHWRPVVVVAGPSTMKTFFRFLASNRVQDRWDLRSDAGFRGDRVADELQLRAHLREVHELDDDVIMEQLDRSVASHVRNWETALRVQMRRRLPRADI